MKLFSEYVGRPIITTNTCKKDVIKEIKAFIVYVVDTLFHTSSNKFYWKYGGNIFIPTLLHVPRFTTKLQYAYQHEGQIVRQNLLMCLIEIVLFCLELKHSLWAE